MPDDVVHITLPTPVHGKVYVTIGDVRLETVVVFLPQ